MRLRRRPQTSVVAAVLAVALALAPSHPEARVSVSVQLTLGGAVVGGAAWALAVAWSDHLGLTWALPPDPGPPLSPPDGGIRFWLPLLVVPLW